MSFAATSRFHPAKSLHGMPTHAAGGFDWAANTVVDANQSIALGGRTDGRPKVAQQPVIDAVYPAVPRPVSPILMA